MWLWYRSDICKVLFTAVSWPVSPAYEGVSKSFWTESIIKYMLTFGIILWEATQRVMAAKLTRLTHKIVIQLHLVAESCTICSFCSRQPVQKLLDTPSYMLVAWWTWWLVVQIAYSIMQGIPCMCRNNQKQELIKSCYFELITLTWNCQRAYKMYQERKSHNGLQLWSSLKIMTYPPQMLHLPPSEPQAYQETFAP
jgi:hypothetical protein